jgi:hypothetical protein
VQSALANLLDNAHKWSPPGRVIEVSVHAGRVAVTDHGPGIEPGDLPHIFDRFYRSSTARAMPGSGLGLAIVQQVAGEHGGSAFAARGEDGGAVGGFPQPGAPPGRTGLIQEASGQEAVHGRSPPDPPVGADGEVVVAPKVAEPRVGRPVGGEQRRRQHIGRSQVGPDHGGAQ